MAEKQYKKTLRSRKAILDAARILVEKNGYEKTTVRAISSMAGLSIGAFYHHFANKDALLNESFIYFDDTLTTEALEAYDSMNALDAIKEILINQANFAEKIGTNIMREYYRALLQEKGKDAIDTKRLYYRTVHKYVEKAQQSNILTLRISADFIADYLIKNVRGNIIDWCFHEGDYNLTEQTKKNLELYLTPLLK